MVDDVWNFHLSIKPKDDAATYSFPVPTSGQGQKVTDEIIGAKNLRVFKVGRANSFYQKNY